MVEEIPSYLYPGLVSPSTCHVEWSSGMVCMRMVCVCVCVWAQAQLHKKSSADAKEVMQKLVSWTRQCLDLETAQQSSPVSSKYKILSS